MKLITAVLLFQIIQPVYSKTNDLNDSFILKQKKFIKNLYFQKRYFNSIAETRRLIIYEKNEKKADEYRYFISGNYFLGMQYKSVIYSLAGTINRNKSKIIESREDYKIRYALILSQSYLKLGLYPGSLNTLKNIQYGDIDPDARYDFLMRRLEPYLFNHQYDMALQEVVNSIPYIRDVEKSDLYNELNRYRELDFKSVSLSVTLSALLPGTGQIYSGKIIDGIISFLGVAITAAGAYYFAKEGNRGFTYSLAFFSSIFYAGNLFSSYNSARSANLKVHNGYISNIKNRYISEYTPFRLGEIEKIFE